MLTLAFVVLHQSLCKRARSLSDLYLRPWSRYQSLTLRVGKTCMKSERGCGLVLSSVIELNVKSLYSRFGILSHWKRRRLQTLSGCHDHGRSRLVRGYHYDVARSKDAVIAKGDSILIDVPILVLQGDLPGRLSLFQRVPADVQRRCIVLDVSGRVQDSHGVGVRLFVALSLLRPHVRGWTGLGRDLRCRLELLV